MKIFNNTKWIIVLLVFLAAILRFYNYENRWTLNQDQARDAVIAAYSIQNFQIPFIGPPSSAGEFSFGPLYYWVIIIFSYLFPVINGSWIGFTLLSVTSVVVAFLLGKKINLVWGVILGLLWAVSSANIFHAPDMLNPMLIGIVTIGAFYSLYQVIEKSSKSFAIVLGFCVGAAINFHFQSLGLIILLACTIFAANRRVRTALYTSLGFLISFAPVIYFDMTNNFAWSKGVFNYFISGQDKFNIHYSLVNDLVDFWPKLWGEVITGIPAVGYFFVLLLAVSLALSFKYKFNEHKSFWVILITFLVQIIILKFYKGPRLPIYLLVYHPFLIFLTGWSVWTIWRAQKYVGVAILVLILSISFYSDLKIINSSTQTSAIYGLKQKIDQIKPGQKRIFTYQNSNTVSLPLFYLWLKEGKISDGGEKIGVCEYNIQRDPATFGYIENCPDTGGMILNVDKYRVFDLNAMSEKEIKEMEELTSQRIYQWLYDRY